MLAIDEKNTQTIERRTAPRRQVALGTICQLGAGAEAKRTGLVWNISTSGVSMLMHDPCPAGADIDGELKTLDDKASLPIGFRVAHVRKLRTGDFLVAGPFRRSLSAEEMTPFLGGAPK